MLVSTRKVIIVAVVLLFATNLFAGWTHTTGGNDDDRGYSIDQTSDGGYIITGKTESFGAGGSDVYLIKTNSNGNVVWTKTWGYSNDEIGESVQQTSDGGYIIGGWGHFGDEDLLLIKTNSSGDIVWLKTYDPCWDDRGYSVQQTTDGGYILAGYTEIGTQNHNAFFVKTSSSGNLVKLYAYGGSDNHQIFSIKQTSDGGYISAGTSEHLGDYDCWIIKLTSDLNVSWDVTIDVASTADILFSIQQTSDGGYICVGYCYNDGFNGLLLKINSIGNLEWGWYYGSAAGYEDFQSVQQTSDGGYIMVGCTESCGAGGKDVYLVKTDNGGNSIWTKTFGGYSDDRGYSVQQTSDGGYIVVGYTESYGAGGRDVYLIKTDANGVAVEETIISSPENSSVSIFQSANNNLSISFALTQSDIVELNLYDISGRLVSTPISGYYIQGIHNISCQIDKSGAYLYKFETSNFTKSGKIIVF